MNYKKSIKPLFLALIAVTMMAGPSFAADVYLVAKEFDKSVPAGLTVVKMWGFATADSTFTTVGTPTVPGPMITVPSGDATLNIHLRNDLTTEPVSIVIPGQVTSMAPTGFIDGQGRQRVVSFTHETAPGAEGTYTWNNLKPGTYIYHSGTHPAVQVQMGLYGGVKKDAAPGEAYGGKPYDNEVILFFSEIDPALHEAVAGGTYGSAYYPSTIDYLPKYFLINGEPFPDANPILDHPLVTNERVLILFLNAGLKTHVPILQGLYMSVIAEDGNLYPYPKEQYSVLLPAMKTMDAILIPPTGGIYGLYDRRLYLTSNEVSGGGMLTHLQVASVTGAPVAANDSYSVNEDDTLNVPAPGVLGNDTPGSTAILVGDVSAGTLALNSDGSFSYAPNPDFNGTDIFTYKASSGALESNVATVAITVNPANDAPVAVDDAATTVEDTAVIVTVLGNDVEVDGDDLTVSSITQGANGSVTNNGTTVTYTPNTGFTGTDSFTYTANDGSVDSNVATVTVTVDPRVNTPPVAEDDFATTNRNTPVLIDVIANDYDPDGSIDPATVVIVAEPTRRGAVVNHGNGTVTYTPRRNFRGTDVFTHTVNDNEGATSNEATVRVNVVRP